MTAPDATAGDGLRSAVAAELGRYWENGAPEWAIDAAIAPFRDVLAAAARDAEAIKRVRELAADYDDGSEWGAALYRGDVVRNQIRRALDPS